MTDKQIIDGVDVQNCEFFELCDDISFSKCSAHWHSSCHDDYSNIHLAHCDYFPNCYYKQLKRKEQECERLKDKLRTKAKGWANVNDKILEEVDQLKAENEELKHKINNLICSENCYKYQQAEKYKQALGNIIDGRIGKCCCPEEYAMGVLNE